MRLIRVKVPRLSALWSQHLRRYILWRSWAVDTHSDPCGLETETIQVQSRIGTREDIRQFPSGSFKSLPRRIVIDGETWIGSQPTRQGLIDCLTGTIGGTQAPIDEDLSLMIQKIRDWEPTLKKGAYGRLTDSVTLGQNVKVSRKANSSLSQDPMLTVFCRVFEPIESQQGSSPTFI